MNNFIEFYTKNNISPVSQNIKDLGAHFNRRNSLYRTLGVAPILFKGRDVLEVAPGSGYNSIVTASYEPNSYDLIEPNPSGYEKMISLFEEYHYKNEKNHFYNVMLEDFPEERQYDIVMCEGLLPGLSNPDIFLKQLESKVKSGGILIITCADTVSVFFETLRRYLSRIIIYNKKKTRGINNFEAVQAAELLSEVFQPHLKSLIGMSRPVEDWIWDNMLNPASASLAAANEFSIAKAFEYFGDAFYFYASSPNCMNDYTWYKKLPEETEKYNHPFLDSFLSKQLNFLHYQETTQPNKSLSERLNECCKLFSLQVEQRDALNPGDFSAEIIEADLKPVHEIKEILGKTELKLSLTAVTEFLKLFEDGKIPTEKAVSSMQHLSSAFGRGQQYISFIKK